jgi:hypothetical protein
MGVVTIPGLLGVSHWIVIVALIIIAGGMFHFLGRLEKRTDM